MRRDPYDVLDIPKNATIDQVKARYRELVKKYHPDKYQGNPLADLAEEKFKEIQQAYDEIIDGKYQSSNYSSSYSNYDNGYSSEYQGNYGFSKEYDDVISMIQSGKFAKANMRLNELNQPDSGIWNYLKAVVSANLGELDKSFTYINKAINLEPGNAYYQRFREQLANTQTRPYYASSSQTTSSCMDCLTCLCFANCCCNGCS